MKEKALEIQRSLQEKTELNLIEWEVTTKNCYTTEVNGLTFVVANHPEGTLQFVIKDSKNLVIFRQYGKEDEGTLLAEIFALLRSQYTDGNKLLEDALQFLKSL